MRPRLLPAASLMLSAATLLPAAQPPAPERDGAVSFALRPAGGDIRDGVVEASWPSTSGVPGAVSVRDTRRGNTIRLETPFRIALAQGAVLTPADMKPVALPRVEKLDGDPGASVAAERLDGVAIHCRLRDPAGRIFVDWAILMRQRANYVREVLTLTAGPADVPITRVGLIDATAEGMHRTGTVKGSPLAAGNFFLGFEHPLSVSSAIGNRGEAEMERVLPLRAGQSVQYSAVVGIARPGQMRRDFLAYLERERAHPYRPFLHPNSWYDIGYFNRYTQQQAMERIRTFGEELHVKRGVVLDSFLFDDGWDDLDGVWAVRRDFRQGFLPLKDEAAHYGAAPGAWMSPWGGYGDPKEKRLAAGRRAGYEIENGGFALSGPRYYARFHQVALDMVTKYGVNQFKFDGTGNVDTVVPGSAFDSDFDAAIHLIGDLRAVKPDLFINLTTGTYPSPFWLMEADSIWRGGEDHGFAGVGSERERWMTYRDMEVYEGVVQRGSLFPLNSLMLHGIIYGQYAHHLDTDPGGDFRKEVRDYFATGTGLQEMYITPSLLTPQNWDDLAEAAKWSRRNADVLVDTHWIGGNPGWLNVYGWASWTPGKGIVTLRNPSDRAQEFTLDLASAFELPAGAPRRYRAHSPWAGDARTPSIELVAGRPHTLRLQPFEVLTLEAFPR